MLSDQPIEEAGEPLHRCVESAASGRTERKGNSVSQTVDWRSEYAIGDERIDAQHRHLFHLANGAFDLEDRDTDLAQLKQLLIKVYEYMKFHFEDEEELMRSVAYSELESHQALHQKLIQEMNSMMRTSRDKAELLRRLGQIMQTWTLTHIVVVDARIAKHLNRPR